MYDSPITLIASEIQMKMENDTLQVVQRYGIDVDKEELMKALAYDRGQYYKGFADGVLHGERLYAPKIGEWIRHISCIECSVCKEKFFSADEDENCQDYDPCSDFNFNYCPNCGAKMKGENDNV